MTKQKIKDSAIEETADFSQKYKPMADGIVRAASLIGISSFLCSASYVLISSKEPDEFHILLLGVLSILASFALFVFAYVYLILQIFALIEGMVKWDRSSILYKVLMILFAVFLVSVETTLFSFFTRITLPS